MTATKKMSTKTLAATALFIALSLVGAHIKIFGTIAFDSLPGFLAALLLGPAYGAAIGFLGHLFTALTSGLPLSIPIHTVIAITMAITMFGFGITYKTLRNKIPHTANYAITATVGTILNGPVSLAFSMGTTALIAGREAAWGLLAILPILVLGSVANIAVSIILFISIEKVWDKTR